MWQWLTHPDFPSSPSAPAEANSHSHCDDCEFGFFNHAATLPFDHIDECHCAAPTRDETTSSDVLSRDSV